MNGHRQIRFATFLVAAALSGSAPAACFLSIPDGSEIFGSGVDAKGPDASPAGDDGAVDDVSVEVGEEEAGSDGAPVAPLPPATLLIHYAFDDDAGSTIAVDTSGNGKDGILRGTTLPTWDLGHIRGGLRLEGSQSQYVQLPGGVIAGLDAMSVACWIRLDQAAAWNRLFDFNAGSTVWVYFSPTGWNFETGTVGTHFAVSSGSRLDPEMQLTETVPIGVWHHVVVVLARPYLIYYLDGVEKARITSMTLRPSDLGSTNQNWLGRSSFPTDPYLWGALDEFRLYSGALTPDEVTQLASQ